MYQITLTQREILKTLIKLYEHRRSRVKSRDIARHIGKDEGTVRNIMLALKSLGLVSSKTGASGGYVPTLKAYEILRSEERPAERHDVQLLLDNRRIEVWVSSIEILDPLSPEGGRVILRARGRIAALSPGDKVKLDPSGGSRIMLEGKVVSVDPSSGQILVVASRFASIPAESVGSLASQSLIMLSPDARVSEAARILYSHNIKGAPVVEEGRVTGIFTMTDLARAVIRGNLDALVADYMSREVISIREDESLLDAVHLMNKYNVGRLLVVNRRGEPTGIITRTDILRRIACFD